MSPVNRPTVAGQYDFDILGAGVGKACVNRDDDDVYWVGQNNFSEITSDPLSRKAIAAAALDALSRIENADTIVFTSVSATADGHNKVCATISGRGVRLKKSGFVTTTDASKDSPLDPQKD